MPTYVFDFYNLYLPNQKPYVNKEFGVRIVPLKRTEIFESERAKNGPYSIGGWKTAKCYIHATNPDDALKYADWLEWLYSFAQRRSIFFTSYYEFGDVKKYSRFYYKHIEVTQNRNPSLVVGIKTSGFLYTRDISFFIDKGLSTLKALGATNHTQITKAIHAYLISLSDIATELKFLVCWLTLERLANEINYNKNLKLVTPQQLTCIKGKISEILTECVQDRSAVESLKQNLLRDFLYEKNTHQKVGSYLQGLSIGIEYSKLRKILTDLIEIRIGLVHNLDGRRLMNKLSLLFILRKILEIVVLRLLGFDAALQSKLLLSQ